MCVYVCRFCVCVCVCLSICACLVFENVYQRYMYSNTHFPVEKTYLCIYSIYIVSVSFAYNMQTATWWSDSTEVHLKDGAGGGGVKENVCMGGIEPDSSTYIPLRWLVRRRLEKEKRNTEVRFYDTSPPCSTLVSTIREPEWSWSVHTVCWCLCAAIKPKKSILLRSFQLWLLISPSVILTSFNRELRLHLSPSGTPPSPPFQVTLRRLFRCCFAYFAGVFFFFF